MTDPAKLTLFEARDVLAPQKMLRGERRESPSPGRGGVRGGVTSLAEDRNLAQIVFRSLLLKHRRNTIPFTLLALPPPLTPPRKGEGDHRVPFIIRTSPSE